MKRNTHSFTKYGGVEFNNSNEQGKVVGAELDQSLDSNRFIRWKTWAKKSNTKQSKNVGCGEKSFNARLTHLDHANRIFIHTLLEWTV